MLKQINNIIILFCYFLIFCISQGYCSNYQNKIVNFLGMEFALIKAGSFDMGSLSNNIGHDYTEEKHTVLIPYDFYMQTTEVTQGQWIKVMGYNPSFFKNCGLSCPVENVTFSEVQKFIQKLNQLDKKYNYRLPTEIEWEYACRAGTKTDFNNGSILHDKNEKCNEGLNEIAWYNCNSNYGTHPVAQKKSKCMGII